MHLLPQFSLRESQVLGQGGEVSELKQFATSLQALFSQDGLLLVTKNSGADRAHYDILTYQWDGSCYQEAGRAVSFNPPETCIWKDQRSNDDVPDRPHRIFRRSGVSGKPAALYPGSVGVGTISSMFNTMEIGHGWDGRKTIT